MLKLFLTTLLILLFSIGVDINGAVNAQTNARQINTAMEDIRVAVVKNLGSQDKEVEVSRTGNVLTISRVNSNMNGAPHQLVSNEATSIAAAVSKAIVDKPEFNGIHTIRVQYLDRAGSPVKNKIVDSVEFRKGKNGVFEIHLT
jgi:hypothetical protein